MTEATIHSAFNAGEISPELYGQVSLGKISSAATTMRNLTVAYRGGAQSRAGLALVDVSLQTTYLIAGTSSGPPRPVPFQFSINQGYMLEFGDYYIRFIFQGGYILEPPVTITGATIANPCQIDVSGIPFNVGDWVFITGVEGMTQLNGNTYIISSATSGSFTITDPFGNSINSTSFGAYTSGGTVSRLYTVVTPYLAEDLPYLKVAQTADEMSLTCSNPETGNEYPPYDLIRNAAADWTFQPTNFITSIKPPTGVTATANTQAPTNGVNATFAYQVTSVDLSGNESVASGTASCHGADLQVEAGTNIVSWSLAAGARYYNVYRAPTSVDNLSGPTPVPVPPGSIFGFVGSAYGTQYTDNNTTPDISQVPPTHQDPFAPGPIEAIVITGPGTGLGSVTYGITTLNGENFSATPVVNDESLGGFLIQSPGYSFAPGDSIAINSEGFATGAIEFAATNPMNGDTITVGGQSWTFVSAISGASQTLIGLTLSATLATLVADLSNSAVSPFDIIIWSIAPGNQNLIAIVGAAGAPGNAFTLSASRATVSGPTLKGGTGSTDGGPSKATGDILFSTNPTNGQTIVLNGQTWTFVASGAAVNQTNIGPSLARTLAQLQADLNASNNSLINVASYGATGVRLNVAYDIPGAAGNSYTLGAGTSGATPSGAVLSGGADSTVAAASLVIGPTSGLYPGVNTYFQQRHFYANSLNDPDTFWASQTGLYTNFDYSIPTDATDSVTASPWSEEVNGIQWLIPMPGGLIAMTGLRAWQILGEGSYILNVQPITPSTVQAQPQAFNGCSATVPPLVIDYDVVYAESVGGTVRDLSWTAYTNIYTGADLTILSSHLFLYRQIEQWTWARNPYKILWASCDDGTMLSLTYLKEQNVYGWARHDTQGLVVGIASVTEPPVNAVYAAVQRFPPNIPSGIYTIERMDNRIWQSVEDAYAVDSGVSNPMSAPDVSLLASSTSGAVIFTASGAAFSSASEGQVIRMGGGIATVGTYTSATKVSGTWVLGASPGAPGVPYAPAGGWTIASPVTSLFAPHLAGMAVVGLADGVPIGPITVGSTGTITLPFAASDVKAGLSFTAQLQTPYLNGQQVVQGARKVIPAATLRLAASGSGVQIGTNQPDGAAQSPPQISPAWTLTATLNTLAPTGGQPPAPSYQTPAGQAVTQLWTGDIRGITGGAAWESKGQIAVQQTLPLPLEISSIEPEFLEGDVPEETYRQESPQGQQVQPRGPGRWMLGSPRI